MREKKEHYAKDARTQRNTACSTACKSTLFFALIDPTGYMYTELSLAPPVEGDSRGRRIQTGTNHATAVIFTSFSAVIVATHDVARDTPQSTFVPDFAQLLTRRASIPFHLCKAGEHRLRVSKLGLRRHQPVVAMEQEATGSKRPR